MSSYDDRWAEILRTDPPPVNPFRDKWNSLICNFGFSYSCLFCNKCPYGEYWKIPSEDEQAPEYRKFLRDTEEWEKRHPDWEEIVMNCSIEVNFGALEGTDDDSS